MKEFLYKWTLKKCGVEYIVRRLFENEDGQSELLKRVFQVVDWYDDAMEWSADRKKHILKALKSNELLAEYLHYLWARDRKQLFDLVGIGKKFSREEQLVKYGAMARISSIIAQLRSEAEE